MRIALFRVVSKLQSTSYMKKRREDDNNGKFYFCGKLFHSQGAYSLNYSAPFNPGSKFDSLIDDARSEPDRQKAIKLASEAMHVLIDEEVAVVPIAAIYNIFAMKEEVQGLEPHPSRINISWAGIYIK